MTDKQDAWNTYKAAQRAERETPRGVAVTVAQPRKPVYCTCRHGRKHHRASGRCRRGCPCTAGVQMARR